MFFVFFFSSRRRHTRLQGDWSSDVCSSDLIVLGDDDDPTPDDHLEKTAELVLGHRRRERGSVDALAPMIAEGGERSGSASRSEERRVGKSVDLGGRRIIKKKKRK